MSMKDHLNAALSITATVRAQIIKKQTILNILATNSPKYRIVMNHYEIAL